MESNFPEIVNRVIVKLDTLRKPDKMLRMMAISTLSNMHKRIHTDGLATDDTPIGKYSKGYVVIRSGNYRNASRWKRGENKGKHKDKKKKGEAGSHIRGKNNGSSRPVYNRGTDPKVILSLTRQMENDMKVIATPNGYGIGYTNPFNRQKALWTEATYHKRIFAPTSSEQEAIREIAQSFIKEELK